MALTPRQRQRRRELLRSFIGYEQSIIPIDITAPASATFLDTDQPYVGASISFADDAYDSSLDAYTVTVACTGAGTFTVNVGSGATVSNDGTGTVTIEGTLAQCNSALAANAGDEGFDDFASGAESATITVTHDSSGRTSVAVINFTITTASGTAGEPVGLLLALTKAA